MMKPILTTFLLFTMAGSMITPAAAQQKSKKELRQERRAESRRQWDLAIKLRKADYHFTLANAMTEDSLTFEDGNISASFVVLQGVSFILQNRLDTTISILWDEASIIMPDGTSEKIIHTGVKLIKKGETMTNTIVPPHAKIDDRMVPVDNVDWSQYSGDWRILNMFGNNAEAKMRYNGKTFSVFLPIMLPSGKKNYDFKFNIDLRYPPPKHRKKSKGDPMY